MSDGQLWVYPSSTVPTGHEQSGPVLLPKQTPLQLVDEPEHLAHPNLQD